MNSFLFELCDFIMIPTEIRTFRLYSIWRWILFRAIQTIIGLRVFSYQFFSFCNFVLFLFVLCHQFNRFRMSYLNVRIFLPILASWMWNSQRANLHKLKLNKNICIFLKANCFFFILFLFFLNFFYSDDACCSILREHERCLWNVDIKR